MGFGHPRSCFPTTICLLVSKSIGRFYSIFNLQESNRRWDFRTKLPPFLAGPVFRRAELASVAWTSQSQT